MRIQLLVFIITLMAGGMQAGTVAFSSNGTAADPLEYQTYGSTVAIAQHAAWAAPLPGSSWVSYGTTGNPDAPDYFMPPNGMIVSFVELLALPSIPDTAWMTFRADDTAALYVNGRLVIPEASSVGNNYGACSDIPVGCLVQTQVTTNIAAYLFAGVNTLRFDVAQRASISFGLNYAGTASWEDEPTADTPEPTTLLLLGTGFVCVGLLRRTRFRAPRGPWRGTL